MSSDDDQRSTPPTASTFHPEVSSAMLQHQHARVTPTLPLSTQTPAPVSLQEPREKTCTKGPALQSQHPAQTARPTEPPFIGDEYMSEDVSPQTVSLASPAVMLIYKMFIQYMMIAAAG